MRIWLCMLSLVLCTGCGAMEELDKGNAILDAHAPKKARTAQAAEEPAEDEPAARPTARQGPGTLEALSKWVEKKFEPPPPPPDPGDKMVRCLLRGHEQFTRRYDCESRGGRSIALAGGSGP